MPDAGIESDQYQQLVRHLPARWEGGLARQEGAVAALLRGLAKALGSLSRNTRVAIDNSIPMTSAGVWLTLHLRSIGLERRADQDDESAKRDYQFEFAPSRNTYAGLLRWLAYKARLAPPQVRLETDYGQGKRGQIRVVVDDAEQDWQPLQLDWVGPLVGRTVANGIIPSIDLRLHCLLQAPLLPWTFLDPLPTANAPIIGPLWERRSFTNPLRLDEARSLFAQVTDSEWRTERLRLRRLHRESLQATGAPGSLYVYLSDPQACPYLLVDYGLPLVERHEARPQVRPYDVDGFHYWDTFPRPPRSQVVTGPEQIEILGGNYPQVWRFQLGFSPPPALSVEEILVLEREQWQGVAPRLYSPAQGYREQRQHRWVIPALTGIWPTLWRVDPSYTTLRSRQVWEGNFGSSASFEGSLFSPLPFYRGAGEGWVEQVITRLAPTLLTTGRAWGFETGLGRAPRLLRQRFLVNRIVGGDPHHCRFGGDRFGGAAPFYFAAQVRQEWNNTEQLDPGLAGGPRLFYAAAQNETRTVTWETWVETAPGSLLVEGGATDFCQPFGVAPAPLTVGIPATRVVGGDPHYCQFERDRFGAAAPFYFAACQVSEIRTETQLRPGIPFGRILYCAPGERQHQRRQQRQRLTPPWAEREWFYYAPQQRRYPGQDQIIYDSPPAFWIEGSETRRHLEPEILSTWRKRGNYRVERLQIVVNQTDQPARPPQQGHNGWTFDQSFPASRTWLPLDPITVDSPTVVDPPPVVPAQPVDPYRWYLPSPALFYYPAQPGEPARSGLPRLEYRPWLAGRIARFDIPYWDPFLSCADVATDQTVLHTRSQTWSYRIPCRESFTRRNVTKFYEIRLEPPWSRLDSPRYQQFVTGRWTLHLGSEVLIPQSRWWTDLARQRRSPSPILDRGELTLALEFLLPKGSHRHFTDLELRLDGIPIHQRPLDLTLDPDENLGIITAIRATAGDPHFTRLPAFRAGTSQIGDPLRDKDYAIIGITK